MILANVRARLGRSDARLMLALLVQGAGADSADAEETLRERGIDALLDDPQLLRALLASPLGAQASLPLFLYVVARHAMLQSGEDDATLADYAALAQVAC